MAPRARGGIVHRNCIINSALTQPSSLSYCVEQWLNFAGKRRKVECGSQGKGSSCQDRQLEEALREFVTFKTVSSDRSLREDCYRGAKYLCKLLVEVLGMSPPSPPLPPLHCMAPAKYDNEILSVSTSPPLPRLLHTYPGLASAVEIKMRYTVGSRGRGRQSEATIP